MTEYRTLEGRLDRLQDQVAMANTMLATISARQERLAPLETTVESNRKFREQATGIIRLLALLISVFGASTAVAGWWMVRTTLQLEERSRQTTEQLHALEEDLTEIRSYMRAAERRAEL